MTTIYVNPHVIRKDRDTGSNDPPIIVEDRWGERVHGYSAAVDGPSTFVYSPGKPNQTGAELWCETEWPVKVATSAKTHDAAVIGDQRVSREDVS